MRATPCAATFCLVLRRLETIGQLENEDADALGPGEGGAQLDHRFVLEFLKVLSPETNVALEIENSETAVVFHADDGAYGYVVMPLSRDR